MSDAITGLVLAVVLFKWTRSTQEELLMPVLARSIGFAYGNWFKPRPAYRFSVEDSIYLAPEAAGQGLGRLLMTELLAALERAGVRKVMAVIGDSANAGSIGVHRALGFETANVVHTGR